MAELARGAEAVIREDERGVVKKRVPKRYRHPSLDERLRRERTDLEARLLRAAREAGVHVPEVVDVGEFELVLERVEGSVLRDVFEDERELWPRLGADIARLHRRDVIHGDLTTSNVVLRDGPVFIDFGLGTFSDRTEDRATDLRLLEQVLESTHADVAEEAREAILGGYAEEADDPDAVLERLEEVRERGRYR